MNRYDSTTHVEKLPVAWRTAYQAAEIGFGVLMAVSAVMYVLAKVKTSKKEEQ